MFMGLVSKHEGRKDRSPNPQGFFRHLHASGVSSVCVPNPLVKHA